ncbi:MAG: TolC family outer membrane protein [Desulfovibrionaceae bacterium]
MKHFSLAVTLLCLLVLAAPGWAQDSMSTDLKRTVVECLQYNPMLESIKHEREAVSNELRAAWGGYLPQLDVAAAWGGQQHNTLVTRLNGTDDEFRNRFEGSVTVTQLIWDGNGQVDLIRKERARLQYAEERLYDSAEALALDAIIAHLSVLREQESVALAEANVEQHRTIAGSLQERLDLGAGSLADVTQANARLALAESLLVSQRQALQNAISNYEKLVGHLPMDLVTPEQQAAPFENVDLAIAAVKEKSPKIMAKKSEFEQSRQDVGIATSNFAPLIYLEGKTDYKDKVESDNFYTKTDTLMVKAQWNLFNGGSDLAARNAALERKIKMRKELEDLLDSLTNETKSTWTLLDASQRNVQNYAQAKDFNVQTRDMYLQQFDVGQRSLLDVLDAENELYTTSGRLITARFNQIIAVYRLYALEGGLISSLNLDPTLYEELTTTEVTEE